MSQGLLTNFVPNNHSYTVSVWYSAHFCYEILQLAAR